MANMGIMHLSTTRGGMPFCRTRRSHMSTTTAEMHKWPRICLKCQEIHNIYKAQSARKIVAFVQSLMR